MWRLMIGLAYILPLYITVTGVLSGSIPFWFDPARDLLAASANLEKISLIGQSTGIPGIFYGPHWVWMLSIGMLFSQDPRIIDLIVLTLPYYTIMPFILFKLVQSETLSKSIAVMFWLLFTLNMVPYTSHLWNLHPAPLLLVVLMYLLVKIDLFGNAKIDRLTTILAGIVVGLILSFHISLGLGIAVGSTLFVLFFATKKITSAKKDKKQLLIRGATGFALFIFGILLVHTPFFVFEARHGFQQSKAAIETLTSEGSVVGVTGLSNQEILQQYGSSFVKVLGIDRENYQVVVGLFAAFIGYFIYLARRGSIKLRNIDVKFGIGLLLLGTSILALYLTSKNPVWDYHFLGVEILFLLSTAFLATRIKSLKVLLAILTLYVVTTSASGIVAKGESDPLSVPNLSTKEHIVDLVVEDAGESEYTVFVYSPFIYTYDYSYLFRARGNNNVPFDPGMIEMGGDLVYLIIPEGTDFDAKQSDFFNYRTPPAEYTTIESWEIPDETVILKREKNP